jgi:hypothetical protein
MPQTVQKDGKEGLRSASPITMHKFTGGCFTAIAPELLPLGSFSMVQNMRPQYPGYQTRPGYIKTHATNDSTSKTLNLYQFNKGKITEANIFVQQSSGNLIQTSFVPPATSNSTMGTTVFQSANAANQLPASFNNINDFMIYSEGTSQHQIYAGNNHAVAKFVVVKASAAIPAIPNVGFDYTDSVNDGLTTTSANLSSLNTAANYHCVFIGCDTIPNAFNFTVASNNANTAAGTLSYYASNYSWVNVANQVDGTAASNKTMAQTGSIAFTAPTNALNSYMYGISKYWFRYVTSAAFSANVLVSEVTYNGGFTPIINMWDGVLIDAPEVRVASGNVVYTYSGLAVTASNLAANTTFTFSSADPIELLYLDPQATPNLTANTTLNALSYYDGANFVSVGSYTDYSAGISKAGFVTMPRATVTKQQYGDSDSYAYWYQMTFSEAISANVVFAISSAPYFNINDLGAVGTVSHVWKDRVVYSFTYYPSYLYISGKYSPQILNGIDYGLLQAGDGRPNKITAMRRYYNELMVWQEEKGVDGGCITIVQGYSPGTYGKLIVSSKLGTFSNKTCDVIDGIEFGSSTDQKLQTLAYFISRNGIFSCDGITCTDISVPIKNYFDPTKTECLRVGYEKEHWLKYDSACHSIRIGLVTGSGTVPNIFPVYNVIDKSWSFDKRADAISCLTEVSAGSGTAPVLQLSGSSNAGYVYMENSGSLDVATAIDAYATMELDASGFEMDLRELAYRIKVQSVGNLTITTSSSNQLRTSHTIPMTAKSANYVTRRERFGVNIDGDHFSIKYQNATANQSLFLYDAGYRIYVNETR